MVVGGGLSKAGRGYMDLFGGYSQCLLHETIGRKYSKNKEGEKTLENGLYGQPTETTQRSRTYFKEDL